MGAGADLVIAWACHDPSSRWKHSPALGGLFWGDWDGRLCRPRQPAVRKTNGGGRELFLRAFDYQARRPTGKTVEFRRKPPCDGGRTRARTWDPMIKSHLLYQLSYAPGTGPEKTLARGPSFNKATPRCPANWTRFSRLLEGARNGEKSPDSSDFSAGFNLPPGPCPQSRPDPPRSEPRSRPSSSRSSRSMPRSKRCWRQPSAPNRCPIWVRTASRRFWPSSSVL